MASFYTLLSSRLKEYLQYRGNLKALYHGLLSRCKTQLIGTGGLRLQSERVGGGGSANGQGSRRRRVDTGQLHWQEVPPRHRQHRASARGLPNLIARCNFYNLIYILNLFFSLLPPKRQLFRADKKKKKHSKLSKRVDKSKFNPPKDISHGFEPYFRVSQFHLLPQLLHFHK